MLPQKRIEVRKILTIFKNNVGFAVLFSLFTRERNSDKRAKKKPGKEIVHQALWDCFV